MSHYSLSQIAASLRLPGWLITTAVIGFLAGRRLVREGLFGDGLCYAAIARNMAAGQGTFWAPFYSTSFWLSYNANMTAFYEHPPLMFGIESWFFRLLGDTLWTEKVYAALMLMLTAWLIVGLWKRVLPVNHPLRSLEWLPLLAWFSMPMVERGMTQNFLDTTMSLFCLLSVWFVLTGMMEPRPARAWLMGTLAVVALLAAFLTKGPVSLHVLGIPVIYGIVQLRPQSHRNAWLWSVGLTIGFLLLLGGLLLFEPARHNLSMYLDQQILAALTQKREITTEPTGRLYLLVVLVTNVSLVIVGMAGLYGLRRWSKTTLIPMGGSGRTSWFWVAVSLSVVVPMMISKKQYYHYLLPALPYMALGLAGWTGMNLLPLLNRLSRWYRYRRGLTLIGGLLWVGTVTFMWRTAGTMSYMSYNDRALLEDIHVIGKWIPRRTRLGVFSDLMRSFPLHPYLQRYYRIDMAPVEERLPYVLVDQMGLAGQSDSLLVLGYRPVKTPLRQFTLYRR